MSNHIFIKNELYNIKILKQWKPKKKLLSTYRLKIMAIYFNLITFIINKKIITKEKKYRKFKCNCTLKRNDSLSTKKKLLRFNWNKIIFYNRYVITVMYKEHET